MSQSRRLGEWPFVAVVAIGLVGLFVVAELDRFRRGSVVFAAAFALAATLRLVLPSRAAGLLAVRSRGFDVVAYAALAVGIAALAILVQTEVPGG